MSTVTLLAEVDDERVQRGLEMLERRGRYPKEAFDAIGAAWIRSTGRNFDAGGRPQKWPARSDGSAATLQRSRQLRRSVHYKTRSDGVQIGSNRKGARLHQLGGVVRPKKRRYLSIPLQKGRSYQVGAGIFFDRYPDLVFSTFEDGARGTVFMKRSPDDKAPRPIFLLRRKVTVPARPFLVLLPEDQRTFGRIIEDYLTGPFA